jgi:Transglycosylase SLT domain
VKPVKTSFWFAAACAGLYCLASGSLRAAPQEGPPPTLSRRPGYTAKPAGKSRSAASKSDSIEVPPPPPHPSSAKSPILGTQKGRSRRAAAYRPVVQPVSEVVVVANRTSPAVGQPVRSVNTATGDDSVAPDPESQRIGDELKRLHADREARQAFYDDLRRIVQEVRAGVTGSGSSEEKAVPPVQNVRPPHPAASLPLQTRGSESYTHPSGEERKSREPDSVAPDNPQASSIPDHGALDRKTYLMVVHWAKANGTPVPLALGVAWMESHLNANPARGAAGEVGMFQIMPSRCTLEGWPARRLNEPQFNAWMGTMLLARYYQEEGSMARAAAKYVAGPGVFNKKYSKEVWTYINWYASTVDSYASYFSRYRT